jgi:hypothetical protein
MTWVRGFRLRSPEVSCTVERVCDMSWLRRLLVYIVMTVRQIDCILRKGSVNKREHTELEALSSPDSECYTVTVRTVRGQIGMPRLRPDKIRTWRSLTF